MDATEFSEKASDKPLPLPASNKSASTAKRSRSATKAAPKKRNWSPFSSLSRRIMAINLFSIVFLAGGILYLDQFRSGLIDARLQALTTNGRMIAGALGEAALADMTFSGGSSYFNLDSRNIRRVMRRLAVVTNTPARLFDREGDLIADSRFLISAGRQIILEELPPPDQRSSLQKYYENTYAFLAGLIPASQDYPLFPEKRSVSAKDFSEVETALKGELKTVIRQTRDGRLMLTAAIPVQGFKRILGALMLVEDGSAIDDAVQAAQVMTLTVFSITVVITLLLSLYLARTIARPIHEMAEAADKVRLGIGRRVEMPDFSDRQDEIADLSISFRQMTTALYDRMDAIEAFAADVAHELKNPLTSLGTAIDTFERIKDEEKRKQLQAVISSDVKRLDRLITDISSASRWMRNYRERKGKLLRWLRLSMGLSRCIRRTGYREKYSLMLKCRPATLLLRVYRVGLGKSFETSLKMRFHSLLTGGVFWYVCKRSGI